MFGKLSKRGLNEAWMPVDGGVSNYSKVCSNLGFLMSTVDPVMCHMLLLWFVANGDHLDMLG